MGSTGKDLKKVRRKSRMGEGREVLGRDEREHKSTAQKPEGMTLL